MVWLHERIYVPLRILNVKFFRVCLDRGFKNSKEFEILRNSNASIEFFSFSKFIVWVK